MATSNAQKRWVVYVSDPAIDSEKSDLLAYRQALTVQAEREHLVYRDGQRPVRYQLRALSVDEYDDVLADAESLVGEKGQRRERRVRILAARAALCAIETPDGRTLQPSAPGWGKALAGLRHLEVLWIGDRVVEMTQGTDTDPVLRILEFLSARAQLFTRLADALWEADRLDVLPEPLVRDVCGALGRPVPGDKDQDPKGSGEAPPLGESDASSSRASPTGGGS